jgi:SAM-dependent methyltransferase
MTSDPTSRFSSRVENYIKYRPSYPQAVIGLLEDECGLTRESIVADVGSGTGILSELFLRNGNRVYGVEPNREMREACERLLAAYSNFVSVEGRAEATTLADESVDFAVAGQALHWFDPVGARREFQRILRPHGWAVAVWNDRRTEGSAFLEDYERLLLEYGTNYKEVSSKYAADELLRAFFGDEYLSKTFDSAQLFDFDGLRGRNASASYMPQPEHPAYPSMMRELEALFDRHKDADGRVAFEYDTKVFYGQLK